MFSYYGSKGKIVDYYPIPKYKTIVEPFAGSARYSLKYLHHDVILCEKNKILADMWAWLIKEATPQELLKYADFYLGQDISELPIREEHKNLIGFCLNRGSASPKNIVQKWSCQVKTRPDWASTPAYALQEIASLVPKIRHWKIVYGSFEELPDVEATWFIDPPYQSAGKWYDAHVSNRSIDYASLAEYCKTRKGQVIVCENMEATWLPFKPLLNFYGQLHDRIEAIWLNNSVNTLLNFIA